MVPPESIIQKNLKHITSPTDRHKAINYLTLLGMKHYFEVCGGESIKLSKLLSFNVDGISESDFHDAQNKKAAKFYRASQPYTNIKKLQATRISRPDAMTHFPFTDQHGTVSDALCIPYCDEPFKILYMGTPARKRLIIKIFEEMKFDGNGVKLCNIPEALQRLGLFVSSKLKRVLERTHTEHVKLYYSEGFITLAQWKSIVKWILSMMKKGKRSYEIEQLFESNLQNFNINNAAGEDVINGNDSNDGEESYEFFTGGDEESKGETFSIKSSETDYPVKSPGNGNAVLLKNPVPGMQPKVTKAHNTFSSLNKAPKAPITNSSPVETYHSRLSNKNVVSRIQPVVKHDRRIYQETMRKQNRSALNSIAQRRVDALTGPALPLGFKRQEDRYIASNGHFNSPTNKYTKYSDLDSGLATMEIADAFLQGDVGRELLTTSEGRPRSYASSVYDPLQEQPTRDEINRTAVARTGIPPKNHNIDAFSTYSSYIDNAKPSLPPNNNNILGSHQQSPYLAYGHNTTRDRRLDQELSDEAKRRYEAPGWRSTRGGWTADFGPSHTHTLYRGPEYHKLTVDDKPWLRSSTTEKGMGAVKNSSAGHNDAILSTVGIADEMLLGMNKETDHYIDLNKNNDADGVEVFNNRRNLYLDTQPIRQVDSNNKKNMAELYGRQQQEEESNMYTAAASSNYGREVVTQFVSGVRDFEVSSVDSAVVGAGEGRHSPYRNTTNLNHSSRGTAADTIRGIASDGYYRHATSSSFHNTEEDSVADDFLATLQDSVSLNAAVGNINSASIEEYDT